MTARLLHLSAVSVHNTIASHVRSLTSPVRLTSLKSTLPNHSRNFFTVPGGFFTVCVVVVCYMHACMHSTARVCVARLFAHQSLLIQPDLPIPGQ